jgi:hypothetical protein
VFDAARTGSARPRKRDRPHADDEVLSSGIGRPWAGSLSPRRFSHHTGTCVRPLVLALCVFGRSAERSAEARATPSSSSPQRIERTDGSSIAASSIRQICRIPSSRAAESLPARSRGPGDLNAPSHFPSRRRTASSETGPILVTRREDRLGTQASSVARPTKEGRCF